MYTFSVHMLMLNTLSCNLRKQKIVTDHSMLILFLLLQVTNRHKLIMVERVSEYQLYYNVTQ